MAYENSDKRSQKWPNFGATFALIRRQEKAKVSFDPLLISKEQ